jgi:pyruvate dehydrogenase (quinone)/pyruvate oxidase
MDMPMKPQVVAWELGRRISSDAIVACDSGTAATWWARQIPARSGQAHSISGTLATMACGLPYALGAQVAYPGRQVVAFVGDGAFSMLMAEMSTAVKYKLPVKIFVLHNDTLGQIKWEQMVMLGNPQYACEMESIDYAAVANACGAVGLTIRDPKECGEIIQQALNTPGPVVIDCFVDPNEPPMPGKIKPDQAKGLAESMIRGEPTSVSIIQTVTEDKFREMI